MKLLLLLPLFFAITFSVSSQCLENEELWPVSEEIFYYDMERDPFGNIYLAVGFTGVITMGGETFDGSENDWNILLLKYDKKRALQWAFMSASDEYIGIHDIEITQDHDVVFAGFFRDHNWELGCKTLSHSSQGSGFLARISKFGEIQWAYNTIGDTSESFKEIAINSAGELIVSGVFYYEYSFNNFSLPSKASQSIYLGKISVTDGSVEWMHAYGDTGYENIFDLKLDSEDNIIMTGTYTGPHIDFNNYRLSVLDDALGEEHHFYVTKVDTQGNTLWARTSDNPMGSEGWSVAVDNEDNVYATGSFFYEDIVIDGNVLENNGFWEYYLTKYSSTGDLIWTRGFGGESEDYWSQIEFLPTGRLILAGGYFGDFALGDSVFLNTEIDEASFMAEMDEDGNFYCIENYSGQYQELIYHVDVDPLGNISTIRDIDYSFNELHIYETNSNWAEDPYEADDLIVDLGFDDMLLCEGESYMLNAPLIGGACGLQPSYLWKGGSKETYLNVSEPGEYWVEVRYGDQIAHDTVQFYGANQLSSLDLNDQALCADESLALNIQDPAALSYRWNTEDTTATITLVKPGTYWVEKRNECLVERDTFQITSVAPLQVELGEDRFLCNSSEQVVLDVENDGSWYNWNTGDNTPQVTAQETRIYSVRVENQCEVAEDEVYIEILKVEDSELPNVITPNGDGKNEYFQLPSSWSSAQLKILNRWGKVVFKSPSYDNTWSGKGHASGVYYYRIDFPECDVDPVMGSLHILR